ncbi:MAG: zinc metallopeptidase [Planctomycetota bacterium]
MLVYLLFIVPPLLLALYAQSKIHSTYNEMSRVPARMTGFEAARRMLDGAGLGHIRIETTPGVMSDHYDPGAKVVRLSPGVFHERSIAAVGIACHEAGHAFQDAKNYAPLVIRNLAVPTASFGSGIGGVMIMVGVLLQSTALAWLGVIAFSAFVFFQLVNLPVEFDASRRARNHLLSLGIVDAREDRLVGKVLGAAALTYVAATLQAVMQLLYFITMLMGQNSEERA